MAVVTRSRAAAQRGLNPTQPNANAVEANNTVHGMTVRGAAGSRKPARGRRAKANGAHRLKNSIEAGDSASTASHSAAPSSPSSSRAVSRRADDNERHMSQPRTTTQTISQTCGLYVKLTFEQVATTSIAGSSSQPLPTSAPEADGAGAKKPRKGRPTMTRRGPKAHAKTGRIGQRTRETSSTVRAGTKRRREDDEFQPSDDEVDSASVARKLRRTRRKTEKAAPADVPTNDDVDEAVNRTRGNKGKARAVDVPTTEEASVGSKSLRDEEDADADGVSQLPLDPGPSRRTTRRTGQKVEQPRVDPGKTTARKPNGRSTVVPAPPAKNTRKVRTRQAPRVSTTENGEPEEPAPIPSPSTSRRGEEEQIAPREATSEVAEKQEIISSLYKPPSGNHTCRRCQREPPEWLRRILNPEPLVPATSQREPPEWLRRILNPEPLVPATSQSEPPEWLRRILNPQPLVPATSHREHPEWLRRILNPQPLVPATMLPGPFVLRPVVWESGPGSHEADPSSEAEHYPP